MKICENCNIQFEDETAYCPQCGAGTQAAKTEEEKAEVNGTEKTTFCPYCGEQNGEQAAFCKKCGQPLNADAAVNPNYFNQSQPFNVGVAADIPKSKGKKSKIITAAVLAVAVIAVVALFVVINPFGSKEVESIAYIKDGELYATLAKKVEPFEVNDDLGYDEADADIGYYSNSIQYSADGRYMFYPVYDGDQTSIYRRDLKAASDKEDAEIKVAPDVYCTDYYSYYSISSDGQNVIYVNSDSNLYKYNMKDKEKIDSGVSSFQVDSEWTKIVYTSDRALYIKEIGSDDKTKIDSDASLQKVSSDFSKIYYKKDDTLYLKEDGKDKVKIASGISSLYGACDDGTMYYTKSKETTVSLSDYVTDDMKDSDAAMTEPMYPNSWDDIYYYDETGTLYNEALEKYYADYEKYSAKESRDSLRAQIANAEDSTITKYTLCYYDGKTETVISEDVNSIILFSGTASVIVYSKYNSKEVAKVKLSEISSIYDVQEMLNSSQTGSSENYVAIKNKETVIKQSDAQDYKLNSSCSALYFIDDYSSEDYCGTLMEAKISGDTINAPTKIDEEVYSSFFRPDGDTVLYFKNYNNDTESGDLYENKKVIVADVWTSVIFGITDTESMLIFTDYSDSSEEGTLNILKGSSVTKIADDVYSCSAISEDKIAYIADYSEDNETGDAYLYNGSSKPVEIDTDVSSLLYNLNKFNSLYYDSSY